MKNSDYFIHADIGVHENGMMYKEHTDESYLYYIGLYDVPEEEIKITKLIEEDFVTILVVTEKNTNFVPKQRIRIVKLTEDVDLEQEIYTELHEGILLIDIPKK